MPIAVTYRTAGSWGPGKGSNLTPVEVDTNFKTLVDAINDMINNPPTAVGIANIVVEGSSVLFYKTDGTSFGPFPLPYVTMHIRSDFDSSVASSYAPLDLIPVPGVGLFLSRIDHDYDVGEPFDPDRVDDSGEAIYVKVFGENEYIYDIGWFFPGRPGFGIDGAGFMAAHLMVRAATLPATAPGSLAKLRVAPADTLSFDVQKGADVVGTLVFETGQTDGVFTIASDVSLAAGDTLGLRPPADIDVDARDLTVSVMLTRVI